MKTKGAPIGAPLLFPGANTLGGEAKPWGGSLPPLGRCAPPARAFAGPAPPGAPEGGAVGIAERGRHRLDAHAMLAQQGLGPGAAHLGQQPAQAFALVREPPLQAARCDPHRRGDRLERHRPHPEMQPDQRRHLLAHRARVMRLADEIAEVPLDQRDHVGVLGAVRPVGLGSCHDDRVRALREQHRRPEHPRECQRPRTLGMGEMHLLGAPAGVEAGADQCADPGEGEFAVLPARAGLRRADHVAQHQMRAVILEADLSAALQGPRPARQRRKPAPDRRRLHRAQPDRRERARPHAKAEPRAEQRVARQLGRLFEDVEIGGEGNRGVEVVEDLGRQPVAMEQNSHSAQIVIKVRENRLKN
ncbi:hypothetical protein SDC9_51204 [bioreactor metagenome]|uniref:Uncharacterized protein n=1 Tax=bioreactor metagenome TaxID=1076179 RepID=A0A644WRM4_9ZZZZ